MVWMEMVLKEQLGQLTQGAPVRDQCQLQCLSSPHSGAWLSPVPSAALGYAMGVGSSAAPCGGTWASR